MANPINPFQGSSAPLPKESVKRPQWLSEARICKEETGVELKEGRFLFYNPQTKCLRLFEKDGNLGFREWSTFIESPVEEIVPLFQEEYTLAYSPIIDIAIFRLSSRPEFTINFFHVFSERELQSELQRISDPTNDDATAVALQNIENHLQFSSDPHKMNTMRALLNALPAERIQHLLNIIGEARNFTHPLWVSCLWPLIDLKREENAKKLVEEAVHIGLLDPLVAAFEQWPDLAQKYWPNRGTDLDLFKIAVERKYFSIARYLLDHGWDCNRQIMDISDPLVPAISSPLHTVLSGLIRVLDNPLDRNSAAKKELSLLEDLLSLLLEKGVDPNSKIFFSSSGISQPVAQFCLLYEGPNKEYLHNLAALLIQNGALITDAMVQKMKGLSPKYREFGKLLLEHGKITEEELALLRKKEVVIGTAEDYLKQIHEGLDTMKEILGRSRGNWNLLDFAKIEQLKQLKRHLKEQMHKYPSLQVGLGLWYETLHKTYDEVVAHHPLLRELQVASREFRNLTRKQTPSPSFRLSKLYSLWAPSTIAYGKHAAIDALRGISETDRTATWHDMRKAMLNAASFIQGELALLGGNAVLRVHGTKLTPPFLYTKQLLAQGYQDRENVISFSGERSGSEKGLNYVNNSFSSFSSDWSEEILYFPLNTRGLLALKYAQQEVGLGQADKYFNPNNLGPVLQRTEWENISRALEKGEPEDIRIICIDIGRLRSLGPQYEESFNYTKNRVAEMLKTAGDEPFQHLFLTQLNQALTAPVKYLSEEDTQLLKEAIPIVFATTNHVGEYRSHSNLNNTTFNEFLLPGRMEFGKDIQVAFVPKEHLARAQQLLSNSGVAVYDFDILKYLETESMVQGAQDMEFEHEIANWPSIQKEQARIGHYLERDILPNYSIPFSEHPSYIDEKSEKQWVKLPNYGKKFRSYEDYIAAVRQGLITPRDCHDRMHATRTGILALALRNKIGATELDSFLTVVTATDHDSQREDDGVDRWDPQSAAHLRNYLLKRGYSEEEADRYSRAISEKDLKNAAPSKMREIMNTADTVEINRIPGIKFDKTRAAIPLEDEFIEEWVQFIKLTENLDLKLALEHFSENYYGDVMKILKLVSRQYPIFSDLLKAELDCFDPATLPPEISQVLERLLKESDE